MLKDKVTKTSYLCVLFSNYIALHNRENPQFVNFRVDEISETSSNSSVDDKGSKTVHRYWVKQ